MNSIEISNDNKTGQQYKAIEFQATKLLTYVFGMILNRYNYILNGTRVNGKSNRDVIKDFSSTKQYKTDFLLVYLLIHCRNNTC